LIFFLPRSGFVHWRKKKILGLPWKSNNSNFVFKRTPLIEEHNKFVYNKLLGFSEKKYERLETEGVI